MLSKEPEKRLTASEFLVEFKKVCYREEYDQHKSIIPRLK
jgi:hypothetical protein